MIFVSKNSARYREQVWNASCVDGDGKPSVRPTCNLCGLPVFAGDAWDVSHVGAPAALDGIDVGVAHRLCNRRDNNLVVTPMVSKVKRVLRKHIGADAPGLGPDRLAGGRRSPLKKTFRHGVVPRRSGSEKHAALMAERYGASFGKPQ